MRSLVSALLFIGVVVGAGATVSGCTVSRGDASSPDGDDVDSSADRGSDCSGRDQRCTSLAWQSCLNGRWRTKQTCLASQVCDMNLGCVACSPSLPLACDGDDVRHCDGSGQFGGLVKSCDPGLCKGGDCANRCGAAADLIYLVDEQYRLLSFNPRDGKNELKAIGNLSCPAGNSWDGGTATPFSMSVDRDAKAWVLYNSGEIFWVSTTDGACMPSGFTAGQSGFETFGMGFVSDLYGSSSETLFVSGGSHLTPGKGNLGSVDKRSLVLSLRGPLPMTEYGPELTGTGKGELYGYFPGTDSFVARFDKNDGTLAERWTLPPLTETVRAWAFAHWGGRFFIFITTLDSRTGLPNSRILQFNPIDGMVTPVLDNLPYIIVGAGVSTCAPLVVG